MPDKLFAPPFETVEPPQQSIPVVFNSPHSGRAYPTPFLDSSKLDAHELRRSEDCFIDELFESAVALGAPLLRAHFPRAYLDVNREPYELDPVMFDSPLPAYVNTRSVRVAGGLGTIARLVSEDQEIYREPMNFLEAKRRIKALYQPYHAELARLMHRTRKTFGAALLVDCHSMPSTNGKPSRRSRKARPDIVLGDRYGSTCAGEIADFFEDGLSRLGYKVVRNKPYAGGYITQVHGQPEEGFHALQIEINRALYVDEDSYSKHRGFDRLSSELRGFIGELAQALPALMTPGELAAE